VTKSPKDPPVESARSSRPGDEDNPASPDPDDDLIDEIGVESFPASDSPSSWSGPPTAHR
jgi:hypothetical protein